MIAVLFVGLLVSGCGFVGWPRPGGNAKEVGSGIPSFAVSPDERFLVFPGVSNTGRHLYVLDLRTRRVTSLTGPSGYDNFPAFSPNGRDLVFEHASNLSSPRYLYVMDFKSRATRQLTRGGMVEDEFPSYSSDGRQVVFARATDFHAASRGEDTWSGFDIWTVGADGLQQRQVTNHAYDCWMRPAFAHNMNYIVYDAYEPDTGGYLRIVGADGNNPRPLYRSGLDASGATFLPNGCQVLIGVMAADYSTGIYIAQFDQSTGTIAKPRAISIGHERYQSWSVVTNGGQSVYYLTETGIWRMSILGTNRRLVAKRAMFDDPVHYR